MIDDKQKNSLFNGRSSNRSINSHNDVIKLIENKKRNIYSCGEESYIFCPRCGKEIDYYWSKFAGVERARCRTPGCFNWNKSLIPKKPKLKLKKKSNLKKGLDILIPKKPKLTLKKPTLKLRKKKI